MFTKYEFWYINVLLVHGGVSCDHDTFGLNPEWMTRPNDSEETPSGQAPTFDRAEQMHDESCRTRDAAISQFRDQPIGVCIVLTAADLRELGIDPEKTTVIQYRVDPTDRCLLVTPGD